jgi:isochorismate hydrolase
MGEYYLTNSNKLSKPNDWLNNINFSQSKYERFKFNIENSSLLIIDMQNFFLNKKSHAYLPSSSVIIPNINSLISIYREFNQPIIFTYHAYDKKDDPGLMKKWWNDIITKTNPFSKIHNSINISNNDIIIRKTNYSAFIETDLDKILKKLKITRLVITGVMTHLCCESTAREAFMRNYEVFFVIDATATNTEDLHISSLKTLSDGFSIPITTEALLKEVKPNG